MLEPAFGPFPEEKPSEDNERILRSEHSELRRNFTRFCTDKPITFRDDTLADHRPVTSCDVALRAEGDYQQLVREQAARDHLNPYDADIAPTQIVVADGKCLLLARPSVRTPLTLENESMMPLALLTQDADSPTFVRSNRYNEIFPIPAAVGVIAQYLPEVRSFRHFPVFTARSFALALQRAQAIGEGIEEARRENPLIAFPSVEPSSIVTAIYYALEKDEIIPAFRDRDSQDWPILGLSKLSIPEGGGSCEVGFLRVSVRSTRKTRYSDQRHRVTIGLNRYGMLFAQYEEGSTYNTNLN